MFYYHKYYNINEILWFHIYSIWHPHRDCSTAQPIIDRRIENKNPLIWALKVKARTCEGHIKVDWCIKIWSTSYQKKTSNFWQQVYSSFSMFRLIKSSYTCKSQPSFVKAAIRKIFKIESCHRKLNRFWKHFTHI